MHQPITKSFEHRVMCHKVTCPTCQKATWVGCGLHIESALQNVPLNDRCAGWKTGVCQPAAEQEKPTPTTTHEMPEILTPTYLKARINGAIDNVAHLTVEDESDGCGSKFAILLVSDAFEKVKRLQRHRMINGAKQGCLAEEMKNIHALTLKLYTVKEYEKKQAKLAAQGGNKK